MLIKPITTGYDNFEMMKNSRWQNFSLAGVSESFCSQNWSVFSFFLNKVWKKIILSSQLQIHKSKVRKHWQPHDKMPHSWVLCMMALSRNIVQSSFFKRYHLRFSKHDMDQNCSAIRCCRWLRSRWLFQFYSVNPRSKQNILSFGHIAIVSCCLIVFGKIWNPSSIRPKSAKQRYCFLDWCAVFGLFGQWCQGES